MKNTFRNNNEDSLRGTGFGSLSWSEANKQSKNAKRFVGSFDQDVDKNYNIVKKKKKEIVTFKNVTGKLPKHSKSVWSNEEQCFKVVLCYGEAKHDNYIISTKNVKKTTIDDTIVSIGDTIMYCTKSKSLSYGQRPLVKSCEIQSIDETYVNKIL